MDAATLRNRGHHIVVNERGLGKNPSAVVRQRNPDLGEDRCPGWVYLGSKPSLSVFASPVIRRGNVPLITRKAHVANFDKWILANGVALLRLRESTTGCEATDCAKRRAGPLTPHTQSPPGWPR